MFVVFADLSDNAVLIILLLIIIVGIIGFFKSVASRRYYKCPVCGESFKIENMKPETCKVCGASLVESQNSNVTDKTK